MHEHELKKNAVVKGDILIVSTSHDKLGNSDKKTGLWLAELAEPYYVFKEAGYDVTIASAAGGEIPIDAVSLTEETLTADAKRFQQDDEAMQELKASVPLAKIEQPESYAAIFIPGGHGAAFDLPFDKKLADVLTKAYAAGKVVSAVCHGPCGLVGALDSSTGKPLVAGKKVAGFTNSEEDGTGKTQYVPFSLEDKLKELGGDVQLAPDWTCNVAVDGRLVTGQNPMSSELVAKKVVEVIESSAK